jgi:hypothetical protein
MAKTPYLEKPTRPEAVGSFFQDLAISSNT